MYYTTGESSCGPHFFIVFPLDFRYRIVYHVGDFIWRIDNAYKNKNKNFRTPAP